MPVENAERNTSLLEGFEEKSINANGQNFALKIWGAKHAPTIIALHGWLDNASSFDYLAPLLNDYRVVGIDFSGHGQSHHRPKGMPYHFVDYVSDVFFIADALNLDDFYLMGHSLGANVAATMAGTFPERVKRLILIDGFGPAPRPASQAAENLKSSIKSFAKSSQQTKSYADFPILVKARLGSSWPLSDEAAEKLCARGSVEKDGKFTWSSDPRLKFASPLRMTEEQAKAFRCKVSSPTLIIVANQGISAMYPENKIKTDTPPLSDYPNAKIERLEGTHHLHMEIDKVESLAKVINEFLSP